MQQEQISTYEIQEHEISELVDRFYAKVRVDAVIGPVFNEAIEDWPAHLALLKTFWSSVLLATRTYKGDPMMTHLQLPLEEAHFQRWLVLFAETARETMQPDHAELTIAKSQRIAQNFRNAIAWQKANGHVMKVAARPN
ncbi:MAG TPA: group III truncated hemoglobin [Acidobacteriaceae bacterium]